jgi:hypothetical protein
MAKNTGTRYRRRQPQQGQSSYVMTCLSPDAWQEVCKVMDGYGISASGAVHHLVRLGAKLKPLDLS